MYDSKYSRRKRRPIWVRIDKGKEFLNKHFQDILRGDGVQFQVCKTPDFKSAVVERAHCTIRDRLYKYLSYKLPIGISMLSLNLSGSTMTRFTRRLA